MKSLFKKRIINQWTKILSAIMFVLLAFTGILLQVVYHMHHSAENVVVWGGNKADWLMIHKIVSVFTLLLAIYHVYRNWQWIVKSVSLDKTRIKKKRKNSLWLVIVFFLATITGLIPWFLFSNIDNAKHFNEIHDKLGLILVIVTIIHFWQHRNWFVRLKTN